MKKTILIVDDDVDLAEITCDMLSEYGYQVTLAADGEHAYELLRDHTYALILLDINLPVESGFEICKTLRKLSTVPIIFASARTSENDRITGYDLGGDDYLPKPYSLKELLSRVNALMRRTYGFLGQDEQYKFGKVEVNISKREVKKNGEVISLSLKEFDLLAYLVKHKEQAIKKETLLQEVWGAFSEVELSTVAVHMRWLREKLEDVPAKPIYLKTVWGVGYMLSGEADK
ncbi:MAG: response regulator transcription factor [bacterium]|nr:response regulator transcription factor [bacterium]